jgi:hypothetical protein
MNSRRTNIVFCIVLAIGLFITIVPLILLGSSQPVHLTEKELTGVIIGTLIAIAIGFGSFRFGMMLRKH